MRGTIHLIATGDYPWIRDLVAPSMVQTINRGLGREGMSPAMRERGRPVVRKLLEAGPATRSEMREALARKGIRPKGTQALVHLLYLMTYDGEIVTGPYKDGKETMVLLGDWLPKKWPKPPRDPGAELARRYLRGYGPATLADFRWWSGLRAGDARAGLEAIGDELVDQAGLLRLRSQRVAAERPGPVRMLPMWDHYYLGYRDRSHVGPADSSGRFSRGGVFFPLVIADGKAMAVWKMSRRGAGYVVRLEPFGRLPARAAIQNEVADLGRFLGVETTLE